MANYFNKHSFDNLVKFEDDGVTLTESYYQSIDALLRGICTRKRRYAEKVGLDFDTIYQECWTKVMTLIRSAVEKGTFEKNSVNPSLISQVCYNHIIDLGRYQFRRVNQLPMSALTAELQPKNYEDVDSGRFTDFRMDTGHVALYSEVLANNNVRTDFDSDLTIYDIEHLFAEGSRERKYIEAIEVYTGVKEVTSEVYSSMFTMTAGMRNELAWYLGFSGSDSSGFRNLENRVKTKVKNYLKSA